jgi:hypothetical protein
MVPTLNIKTKMEVQQHFSWFAKKGSSVSSDGGRKSEATYL